VSARAKAYSELVSYPVKREADPISVPVEVGGAFDAKPFNFESPTY